MGTKDDIEKPDEKPEPKGAKQPKQTQGERAERIVPGPEGVKVAKGTVTL